MSYTVARSALPRPEPFDAIPVTVQARTDLTGNPKRLYGALSSAQRMGWQPTYAELADRLGASERSIVRWVQRLIEAGLIAVRRRGQGLSNLFRVLALVTSGDARTVAQKVTECQASTRIPLLKEKGGKKDLPPHPRWGFSAIHYPGGP